MTRSISPLNLANPPLDGVNLIEASAGTGKTYAICAIILHLLLGKGIPVEKILAVTFTVAATEELKGRIRTMLRKLCNVFSTQTISDDDKDRELIQAMLERYGQKKESLTILKTALRDFDKAAIFTIHGFCQRMLSENAFESSSLFDTELLTDADILIKEASKDFWRRTMYCAGEAVVRYADIAQFTPESLVALAKSRPLDPALVILPEKSFPEVEKIESDYSNLKNIFDELKKLWNMDKQNICELIQKALLSKKLNGHKYKESYMPGLINEIDLFFSENFVPPLKNEKKYSRIDRFSSSMLNERTNAVTHEFCVKLDDFLSLRDRLLSDLQIYFSFLKKEFTQNLEAFVSQHRNRKNARTFEDLLTGMHRALNGDPSSPLARRVRERFHAALIDEFQDTDPLQYEIFSTIFRNHCPLYMIGDPKQAIYKFRGADIFAYLRASSQCDRKLTLAKNFRSHPDLIRAINAIFEMNESKNALPFVLDGITYQSLESAENKDAKKYAALLPPGSPLTIWFIVNNDNNKKEDALVNKQTAIDLACALIIKEITSLIQHGVNAGDIAILVRKNKQSNIIARALRAHGIPCVTYGTESILDTEEAIELERVLCAIAEPSNRGYLAAALATNFFGKNASELSTIVNSEDELAQLMEQFKRYRQRWDQHGFIAMFRQMMQENEISVHLASFIDGERKLTNVFHIAELIHRAEREERLGVDGILKWFSEKKSLEIDEMKLRLETDEYAVKILTIHKSKGLEFPIVFTPFLYDSAEIKSDDYIYHSTHERGETKTIFDLSGEGKEKPKALLEELSESVRLMYVALTRAKARCYTLWGNINKSELSAPMYVFHNHNFSSVEEFLTNANSNKNTPNFNKIDDLRALEKKAKGTISINVISESDPSKFAGISDTGRETTATTSLSCRTFVKGPILAPWSLTSFSSLIFNAKEEYSEKSDEISEENLLEKNLTGKEQTIHTFPRGTRPGLFIHEIFENIDFQHPNSPDSASIIANLSKKYSIAECWIPVIASTVKEILMHPLEARTSTFHLNFRLAELGTAERTHELEFYFPASSICAHKLAELILAERPLSVDKEPPSLARLGLEPIRGFIRGFIDLVFTIHGRWFLADWKSNHLGPNVESYRKEHLERAMLEHYYYLQYHIYAVALHRHLRRTIHNYDYDSHFGGVLYFFVRGIHRDTPETGIYFDRPSKLLINALDDYLGRFPA